MPPLTAQRKRVACLLLTSVALLITSMPTQGHAGSGETQQVSGRAENASRRGKANESIAGAELPRRQTVAEATARTREVKLKKIKNLTQVERDGSSSDRVQRAAVDQLPLKHLSPGQRQQAQRIVESISLFRRLPTVTFAVEPAVYKYFLTYPEVAVAIWHVLEISEFELEPGGANAYSARTEDGTVGTVHVLHRNPRQCLILCEGEYNSPFLLKPIRAQALIHLQASYVSGGDGGSRVTHHADLFVKFPSRTVGTAAMLLSPLSNMIVDRNFREISLFVHMMSLAMQRQPGWVEYVSSRLEGVSAERKLKLLTLTAHTYVEARKRTLREKANSGEAPVPLEKVMPPVDKNAPTPLLDGPGTDRRKEAQTRPGSPRQAFPDNSETQARNP